MRLSEDRIGSISHKVADAIWNDDLVDFPSEGDARKEIKAVLTNYLRDDDEIDSAARLKIASQKKKPPEGSDEWEILYAKYRREEQSKRNK
jgi:hypothetical protein